MKHPIRLAKICYRKFVVDLETQKEISSEQLARQCKEGCQASFEILVQRFSQRIYNFLFRLTNNAHDAEDLTQETFLRVYKGLANYDPKRPFSTWIFTIAKRRAATHYQISRKRGFEPEKEIVDERTPRKDVAEKDDQTAIWNIARRLKKNQYQSLWLKYGEGFSVKEIAEIMNLNQVYVKVLLHRGRNRLVELVRAIRDNLGNAEHFDMEFIRNPLNQKTES
ncbi:MAG TPA: sigma-70 family RNA polymerase sigma factor [Verrucomicrobiales bacterium]|nr:sigma-70 family RNA polymerase sigma factor [Verrucomicrobiales bacterium]